ncbi:MAG TPA: LysM peptidoglycan-binding domain-containing protein [Phycisphaerae bacterium]|nr:LysM peptidoglycan-binding domain-containing protein [Phycisphaerae bacterium]HNU43807.1 LysM peptidoglycan-binding domain-containing protein [Phycisphaerae bacterium]
MRRNATYVLIVLATVTLVGCHKPKDDAGLAMTDPAAYQPTTPAYEPLPAYATTPTESPAATALSGGRYHTVARHDTLYSLARKYYNDQKRWKDIYEANRDKISDPNRIMVGQQLLIP